MGDLKFDPEVEESAEHRHYGWQVPAAHKAREAAQDLLADPGFQELAQDLKPMSLAKFNRGVLDATRNGTVQTLVAGVWKNVSELNEQPGPTEAPKPLSHRERR